MSKIVNLSSAVKGLHLRSPGYVLSLIILPLMPLLWTGCEKVIDVNLSESDPAVVIEGNLSLEKGLLEVKISKTGSYFDKEALEKIENADVFLDGGPGFRVKAENAGNGLYKVNNLLLKTGLSYRLNVNIDDKEYSAISTLYPKVKIDSLGCEYQSEERFYKGGYRFNLFIKDPPGTDNYYRVRLYKNKRLLVGAGDMIIFDDNGLDGKGIKVRLGTYAFAAGDTAKVELLSIDKNIWEYFRGLREMNNLNPGSPAPANPVSNISNGALGYFSAWSSSSKEIVIP